MSWMMWFDPTNQILKVSCCYLHICEVITDLGVNGQLLYSTVQHSGREREKEKLKLRFLLRMGFSSWEGRILSTLRVSNWRLAEQGHSGHH